MDIRFLHFLAVAPAIALAVCARAADDPSDAVAKGVLDKAGIHATVCEMPCVGDGTLAAALARAGVAQVHALAPDAKAVEAARKPAADCGVLGSQVIVETGKPDALPLGDWVADLVVVADATDANLKEVSAAEIGRVLSPYRGVAVIGNPGGAKSGLSQAALTAWGKGTGGTVAIKEDASGLWAVIKMPPLKGGDDWGHYYHGPDGNPVSKDTAFVGKRYQLQWHDLPIQGERNYTVVVSAGRLFIATCSMYFPLHHALRPQHPYELEARGLYNAKVLWRRPISARFGDMASLLVATPERLYAKDDTGVLLLNPETGAELSRIAVTKDPLTVRWIMLSDNVLLTLAGPQPFKESLDVARPKGESDEDFDKRTVQSSRERDACQGLTAWDPATGKQVWQFRDAKIYPRKMAVSAGKVFLYVNDSDALCLDLGSGKELWHKPASSKHVVTKAFDVTNERRGDMLAVATPKAYIIFDGQRLQFQAFAAADGSTLWTLAKDRNTPGWAIPRFPYILGDAMFAVGVPPSDVLSGKPIETTSKLKEPKADSCGHGTALESGLMIGNGVWDMATSRQLMPNLDKSGCGLGYFVADGTEVMFPNCCTCYYQWSGMFAVRASPERPVREAAKFETGDATTPVETPADPRDWPTYRADITRRASSAAEVPAKAAIRWMYVPQRPKPGQGAAELPAFLQRETATTQVITAGKQAFFGTPEGALVCLDSGNGKELWRYWTAGTIKAAPTYALGRICVGSSDGWVYCLDAGTGKLCWRYRMAPEERRLTLMGGLGSAWPVWSNVLVRDGVAYIAAGLRGKLDGSVLCALDVRTGAVRWEKFFQKASQTDDKGNLINQAPSGGGQLVWYDSKLWWHGGEWGLAIVDPATGATRPATNFRTCLNFNYGINEDIGVLPGGWVCIGGWKPVRGVNALMGSYQAPALFFRSGPDGLPTCDPAANSLKDTSGVPHFLKLTSFDTSTRVSRQIPMWDERDMLLAGDFNAKEKTPRLCQNVSAWLNAEDDAHPWTLDAANKILQRSMQDIPRVAKIEALPADCQRKVLPDDLDKAVTEKKATLSGLMALSKNTVILTVARDSSWPGTELHFWRAIAVSRTDRSMLWELPLPTQPALTGISLTRDGDVLMPLMDGRVVCIGADAPERAVPAVTVADAKPGLSAQAYATDAVASGYVFWTSADFAIMKPIETWVATDAQIKDLKATGQTLQRMQGFLEAPVTGKYRFSGKCSGGSASVALYDQTGQFIECEFGLNKYGGGSDEVLLEKGRHPISIAVPLNPQAKTFALQWESPGIKRSDVPAEALSYLPEATR